MSKLCLGCMQQKENSPVCEHCGFDERKENQSHQLPLGTLLKNQYLVGKVLGQGGFGITYIGWDRNLSIPVAIKEYFPSGVVQRHTHLSTEVMCVNGEAPEVFIKHRDRFLKEARTLAQLSEIPEIVQIKGFFSENATAYIVMEYVQGITLKDHLKKLDRPMTEEEALTIMQPVLKALQKVHDFSLIHRDISPDNIMLPTGGGIKLIDFGTVRYMDDSGMSKSTETLLKPGFAPMEQYNTRGNLGTWTDVYAICATFHYLLTGKVPPEVMSRFEGGEQLTELRGIPQLSKKLVTTLEKGMAIQVPKRIGTIQELCDLLYPKTKSAPRINPAPERKRVPKRRFLFAAMAAAIVLAMGFGLLTLKKVPAAPAIQTIPQPTIPSQAITETKEVTEPASSGLHEIEIRYDEALLLAQEGHTAQAAIAFGKLGNYKDSREQSFSLWDEIAQRETFLTPRWFTVGLRTDGTVLATGKNTEGQCNVENWTDIIAISASMDHTVGLKSDGTVVATGDNSYGQCDVSEWTEIVAITAGYSNPIGGFTAGLKADGTVVTTGNNDYGQCDVSDWTDIIFITTASCSWNDFSSGHTVGLRADGTVLVAGENEGNWLAPVSEWRDVVSVSAGGQHIVGLLSDGTAVCAASTLDHHGLIPSYNNVSDWQDLVAVRTYMVHTLGLKADGTVVCTGNVSHYNVNQVSDWQDITDIYTGSHTLGLRSDGTVAAFGSAGFGQTNVSQWTDIAAIYASYAFHTIGIRSDGTAIATGDNRYGQCDISHWTNLVIPERK